MNIIVVEQRGSGGMIHYAYQLCTALAEEGADVTLITTQGYELHELPHNFKVEQFMQLWDLIDPLLFTTPPSWFGRLRRDVFWTLRRATRAIRLVTQWLRLTLHLARLKPDVVLFGQMKFSFEALFLWYLKQRGLFLSQICHEFELRDSGGSWLSRLEGRLYYGFFQLLSVIFVHGDINRQKFLSLFDIPAERVCSIRHGNELLFAQLAQRLQPSSQPAAGLRVAETQDPQVLFFGNVTPSKGVEDLVEAFALIQARCPTARLRIAGTPAINMDMNKLYRRAEELGLSAAIHFDTRYIPLEEIGPLMQAASVVVFPYHSISQSGALQVAYAFAKPVVATRVGGFPEAVEAGENGYLVEAHAPEALAEAVLKILADPARARQMGQHSRILAETRFAWRPIAQEVLSALAARHVPAASGAQLPV